MYFLCYITVIRTFLYFSLTFDGIDTKNIQAIKIVQHDFDKIIFTAMVTDNRQAAYAISQLQCTVVYRRAKRSSSSCSSINKINSHHGTPCPCS